MPHNQRTIKEKILAILSIIILFTIVGSVFAYVGVVNKRATIKLQEEVRIKNIEKKIREQVLSLNISDLKSNEIKAKAFFSILKAPNGLTKVLAEKNKDGTLPLASVTKLMTAIITLENLDLKTQIKATSECVGGDGTSHVVSLDKIYTVESLLNNMLVSSDNDSARLLASSLGNDQFVSLMNKKAKDLGLTRTLYVNATGLDPLENEAFRFNISSASDVAKLVFYINENYPQIFEITRNSSYNFCDIMQNCNLVLSTNKLLTDTDFKLSIIGGKTGQTDLAKKNLALILEPIDGIFLVNVVLGSEDNFADTKNILNHLKIN